MSVHTPTQPTVGVAKGRFTPNIPRRQAIGAVWRWIFFGSTAIAIVLLLMLLWSIVSPGWDWLSWQLITDPPGITAENSGMNPAIWGSVWIVLGSGITAFLLGLGTAVYLEEYASKGRFNDFIHTNISNLAGVPSIVYGLLGLVVFVDWLSMGRSLLAGSFTMALLILPVVVISSREAIRAVPSTLRQASYGLGATRWQTVRNHVLPAAFPGILTGIILAMSRAIGETAPLLVVGGASLVMTAPTGPMSRYMVMPLQIYNWTGRPQKDWEHLAAAAIIILMTILLLMNSLAIGLRQHFSKKARW